MIVQRVEKHMIKKNHFYYDMFCKFTHQSKNLYNHANYLVRKEFVETGKWLRYGQLDKLLRQDLDYPDYMNIPGAQSAQQTLRLLDTNWKSFFKSIKDWSKNKDKYSGRPKLPKYKPKDGQMVLVVTNQQVKLKRNQLIFPRSFDGFKVTPRCVTLPNFEKLNQVRKVTSKGVVNIKADKNVTLVSAKLVSPSGSKQELKIENNAVSTEVDLTEKGDYTVEYEFSANNNEAGTVTGSFVVNSKEELSGDKVEAGAKELPSTKDEKTDKLVPTPEEPTTEEVTTTVQKPKEEKQLPKTGTDSSVLLSAIGAISAVFGGLLYKKGKTE